jgi:tripartite ATP-independent transporter DctM subunit
MTLLLLSLFLLLALGVRIAFAIGISATLYIIIYTDISPLLITQQISAGSDSIVMLALPFFLLSGELMNAGGITQRLVRLAMSVIGNVRGGLSFVVVVTNMIMAAVSGAAIASGAAIGSVMIKSMQDKGYPAGFSGAINAAAATIGPVIPPSVGFIIYASVSNASVGKLFIAGTIPGLILGIGMIITCYALAIKHKFPAGEKRNWKEVKSSFKGAVWSLLMPVIIIGGIMSGAVTATEAGVIAVVYGLIIGIFVHRTIKFSHLPEILTRTAKQTARIMIIIACASAFGWIISSEIEPAVFIEGVLSITQQKWSFLILIITIIAALGMVMEGGSIMIILTPLLLPILHTMGIDIIHFGVIFQLAIMLGLITPPVGILLFVISGAGDINIKDILRSIWPFYIVIMAVIIICSIFPDISLWLIQIFGDNIS